MVEAVAAGDGRAADIATQTLEHLALMGLYGDAGVAGSLRVYRLVKHRVVLQYQLIEWRLLGPIALIAKKAGACAGLSCRSDDRHDSFPCDFSQAPVQRW